MGVVAVTSDVDTSQLSTSFDLSAYNGLMDPEQYDSLVSRARERLTLEKQAEADAATSSLQVRCP